MDTTTIINDAISSFESSLYPIDADGFNVLSIQDVVECARVIEREREERQSLCNLRRIEPLLRELQRLGEAIRKLPGTSCPEHYTWVSIMFLKTLLC